MKLLIISDTHLMPEFEKEKFEFLAKVLEGADRVVVNGDFWDGYFWDFEDFVNSPWKKLFPLLKRKGAIYITGNHDREYLIDKKLAKKLFCKEVLLEWRIKLNGKTYHIEHGHRILPFSDVKLNLDLRNKAIRSLLKTVKLVEKALFKTPARRLLKDFYYKSKAEEIKRKVKKKDGVFYIFGHVHYPTLDKEKGIATSGSIEYGEASFIEITKAVKLKEVKYLKNV